MSRNLPEESRLKQGRFCDSPKGRWEERDFQRFPHHHRLIVSPLAAMMTDQVEQLKRFGITATAIVWGP